MTRRLVRIGLGLALGCGLVSLPQVNADEPKTPESEPPRVSLGKGPDWSGYVTVSDVVAEVVSGSDTSLTLRVYYLAPNANNNNNQPRRSVRPRLGRNNGRQMYNPYSSGRYRRPQGQAGVHWDHHDYTLAFAPEGMARIKIQPPKIDADGKRGVYTRKEEEEMRFPPGAPGFAASKSDLTPGAIVDVVVVRDRTIPAAKVSENDLLIKYAVIIGHDPNASKNLASGNGNNKNGNTKKK